MKEYHKIQTMFKRDMENQGKIIEGDWTFPEFEYLANNAWVMTEKVDGTNIRVMWDGNAVKVGGKTDNANLPAKLLTAIGEQITADKMREVFGEQPVCMYGEGYGAGIQKGGAYRPDQAFVLFDILIGEWWLQRDDLEGLAVKLGIDIVPIIKEGTLLEALDLVRNGMQSTWGDFMAEGLVLRPKLELRARHGHRLITKIKHRDFTGGRF